MKRNNALEFITEIPNQQSMIFLLIDEISHKENKFELWEWYKLFGINNNLQTSD